MLSIREIFDNSNLFKKMCEMSPIEEVEIEFEKQMNERYDKILSLELIDKLLDRILLAKNLEPQIMGLFIDFLLFFGFEEYFEIYSNLLLEKIIIKEYIEIFVLFEPMKYKIDKFLNSNSFCEIGWKKIEDILLINEYVPIKNLYIDFQEINDILNILCLKELKNLTHLEIYGLSHFDIKLKIEEKMSLMIKNIENLDIDLILYLKELYTKAKECDVINFIYPNFKRIYRDYNNYYSHDIYELDDILGDVKFLFDTENQILS